VDEVVETRAVSEVSNKPLSGSKVQILRLLSQRGQQTSTQVARFLGVSKPAVSQIVDSMVRAKLVSRRGAKEDRREVILELTKGGKDLFRAIQKSQRQVLRNMMRNSKSRDAKAWSEMLNDMAASLAQADHLYEEFCLQCGAHANDTCVLDGGNSECLFLRGEGKRTEKVERRRATPVKRARRR
jgi:DNA-binding MarR family transcriptional regulator